MLTAGKILTDAHDLLLETELTKFALARDATGQALEPFEGQAVSYCAVGLIAYAAGQSAYDSGGTPEVAEAITLACQASCELFPRRAVGVNVPMVNVNNHDETTKQDMLDVFSIAAEKAKALGV